MLLLPFRIAFMGSVWSRVQLSSSSTSEIASTTVNAYPLSKLQDLEKKYFHLKIVRVVRHAEGTHNVDKQYRDERYIDARLTKTGSEQCQALSAQCADAEEGSPFDVRNSKLVVTSTMTRCIETALQAFPRLEKDQSIKFVAQESIRETVNYACDRSRPTSEVQEEFPRVDFSQVLSENDSIWNDYLERLGPPSSWDTHRESAELWKIAERGREFLKWLRKQPEREIIVCTHSAFLRCILGWGQDGGVESIMTQILDERPHPQLDVPLLRYCGDKAFEKYMRAD
eukprot:CAMPEP_0194220162 /NCGR_PEP_ID=MMETSP0156-20130528/27621_1 /TAXON_ID=33649 /ORGANISM="Thalassionema nitzschioides, Strain L26-B" /LENGTH=283 /DNA_ID=CAMNT_0038950077 /DNA_START=1 /DNA_END=849 /DNA_ORIENTATION=-